MEILSLVLLFTGRGRTDVYMYMYVYLGRRAWSRIVSAVVCVAASPARPGAAARVETRVRLMASIYM